jgi:hypothetical protein
VGVERSQELANNSELQQSQGIGEGYLKRTEDIRYSVIQLALVWQVTLRYLLRWEPRYNAGR